MNSTADGMVTASQKKKPTLSHGLTETENIIIILACFIATKFARLGVQRHILYLVHGNFQKFSIL